MTAHWFVFQVKRAHDRTAAADLVARGFPTYLPMEQRERRTNHRLETVLCPRLHPYLFARFDASPGGDQWVDLLHEGPGERAGIVGILRDAAGNPVHVHDRAMQLLWGYVPLPPGIDRARRLYQPGEVVRVYITPGVPSVGIFEGYQRGRAMVKIWMFGREQVTPVAVSALEVDETRLDIAPRLSAICA